MYAMVKSPGRKLTQDWLDQAFAPLKDYLEQEYPREKDQIISYLMFMGNDEGKFYYKNTITRALIVLDQAGEVVSIDDAALQFQFEDSLSPQGECRSLQDHYLHPNVTRWIEQTLSKSEKAKFKLEVGVFLQEIWGPIVNYDFSDLVARYPIRRFCPSYFLYVYPSKFRSLIAFQFVDDDFVEKSCS